MALTPDEIDKLIDETREFLRPAVQLGIFDAPDPDRRDILVAQIGNLDDRLLPPDSRSEILNILKNAPRSRGRAHSQRNLLIREAVRQLVQNHGLTATRGPENQNKESACSLVAKALAQLGVKLKERGIEDVLRVRD